MKACQSSVVKLKKKGKEKEKKLYLSLISVLKLPALWDILGLHRCPTALGCSSLHEPQYLQCTANQLPL